MKLGDAGLGPQSCQTWSSVAQVPLRGPREEALPAPPCLHQVPAEAEPWLPPSPQPQAVGCVSLTALNVRILFHGLSVLRHRAPTPCQPQQVQTVSGARTWRLPTVLCGRQMSGSDAEDSGRRLKLGTPGERWQVLPGQKRAPQVGWKRFPTKAGTGSPCRVPILGLGSSGSHSSKSSALSSSGPVNSILCQGPLDA